jgi:hypothetical protein
MLELDVGLLNKVKVKDFESLMYGIRENEITEHAEVEEKPSNLIYLEEYRRKSW